MNIRDAKISDAKVVHSMINYYAELDRMLYRSIADIYENLQTFKVAELNGRIIGCCALQVVWSDLAEIKSLAIKENTSGLGVGRALVTGAIEQARRLGIAKVFALTLEPAFFEKIGFRPIDTKLLPMKVWSDCAACPKQKNCDEVAVIIELE